MAYKETKFNNHSTNVTTTYSFKGSDGSINTTTESWTDNVSKKELTPREIRKERQTSLSEFLGVGRYFVIFCLILFFVAPVYNDLINDYTWQVEENGNTYKFTNPNENNIESYKYLGNKIMNGFVETLDAIGDISQTAGNITDTVGKVTGWFTPVFDTAKNMFNGVLMFFNDMFD